MDKRTIKRIILAQDIKMGDITLKQPLPIGNIEQVDPFLLLHHFGPVKQEPFQRNIMDIGPHPHRGFEPVTFIIKGEIHHMDSRGNDSIIKAGGVQWMTTGMGIIHSEAASKAFVEQGGELEIIQLWVNLPSHLKMVQPKHQAFQKESIPTFTNSSNTVIVNIIAGEYSDLRGPVHSITGINAFMIEMQKGAALTFREKAERNAIIYQLNGIVSVNGVGMGNTKLAIFNQDGDKIEVEAMTESRLLYLSGTPINEPIARQGPFVMNNQTEILHAMRDYQMGKMGVFIPTS